MADTANKPVIIWFRQDLRMSDHPALASAVKSGKPVICLYILDETSPKEWAFGGASKWWLHHSLTALSAQIAKAGAQLYLRAGQSLDVLTQVIDETGAEAVYFTRGYEPFAINHEQQLRDLSEKTGIKIKRYGGHLLLEPEQVNTKTGGIYKVYTPFSRAVMSAVDTATKPAPRKLNPYKGALKSDALASWDLLPTRPDWSTGFDAHWTPGEAGAVQKLKWFIKNAMGNYSEDRDRPDRRGTSQLSAHLRFGEISPRQIWNAVTSHVSSNPGAGDAGAHTFLKEVVWREFSYHLLFHFPHIPEASFKPEFDAFPWRNSKRALAAWQTGQTGYPIVDAGMRELWHTGWMHNRVRMIVGSFLIKHLLLHWRHGEDWFWDCLVDADMASNSASWQWVAGSGADASPYFRIFNPILQGEKFDPNGDYIRKWCPELKDVPTKYLFAPWDAPKKFLDHAGVTLGKTYPKPIVDHKIARQTALDAYEAVKAARPAA